MNKNAFFHFGYYFFHLVTFFRSFGCNFFFVVAALITDQPKSARQIMSNLNKSANIERRTVMFT